MHFGSYDPKEERNDCQTICDIVLWKRKWSAWKEKILREQRDYTNS